MAKQKIEWIDFIRGMAIIAVLLDHSMIIYQNRDVQLYSQYSVTLFVFFGWDNGKYFNCK